VHAARTVLPLLSSDAAPPSDRCDGSLALVKFDGVAAGVGNQLLIWDDKLHPTPPRRRPIAQSSIDHDGRAASSCAVGVK
jgi:hypothetical protein